MTRSRIGLGQRGELLARQALERAGHTIVASNVRTPYGEIDLVCRDGEGLAFVEVRTKRGDAFGVPEESLSRVKRERMEQCALHYLAEHGETESSWRLDLVAVELGLDGRVRRVEHIPGIEV